MTMFKELYQFALGANLSLTISADEKQGRMTVNVMPKPKSDTAEPALSTPLTLTATPEEFDADFVKALTGFRHAHIGLTQQALVTQELLAAAKASSAKKATDTVAKASGKLSPPVAAMKRPALSSARQAEEEGVGAQNAADVASMANPVQPQLFG